LAPRQRELVCDAEVTTLRLSAFRFPFYFVPSFVIAVPGLDPGIDPAIYAARRLIGIFR